MWGVSNYNMRFEVPRLYSFVNNIFVVRRNRNNMDLLRDGEVGSNVEEEESCSPNNNDIDKNVDAEEDILFCDTCHSWEHDTMQCPKNPPGSISTNLNVPNANSSKMPKASDKVRPRIFPISIKLLRDKKVSKTNALYQNQSDQNALNERFMSIKNPIQ